MAFPVLLLLFLVVLLAAIYKLIRFAFSDADGSLLSKGPLPAFAFRDKVVWITGASQGIGESLAYKLAKQGGHLILSSRNGDKLNRVKARCEALSSEARVGVVVLDLAGGSAGIQAAVKEAEATFAPAAIHFLIHNAGHPRPKMSCEESSEAFLRALFEVNVFAPIEVTRAALPAMRQHRQGRIVVVSSAAGKVPSPTQGVYAASKHAVNGYFHTLRAELSGTGVEVTVVCPGPVAPPPTTQTEEASVEDQKNRMTSDRCADLILAAAFYGVDEAWISPHPVLLFMYLFQFLPRLGYHLMRQIGPKRLQALKSGEKDLYSANLLFSTSTARKKST